MKKTVIALCVMSALGANGCAIQPEPMSARAQLEQEVALLRAELQRVRAAIGQDSGRDVAMAQTSRVPGQTSRPETGRYSHFRETPRGQGGEQEGAAVLSVNPSEFRRVNERLAIYETAEPDHETQHEGYAEAPAKSDHQHQPPQMKPVKATQSQPTTPVSAEMEKEREQREALERAMFPSLVKGETGERDKSNKSEQGRLERVNQQQIDSRPARAVKAVRETPQKGRFVKASLTPPKPVTPKKDPVAELSAPKNVLYTVKLEMDSKAELKAMDKFMRLAGVEDRYQVSSPDKHTLYLGAYSRPGDADRRVEHIASITGWHPAIDEIER